MCFRRLTCALLALCLSLAAPAAVANDADDKGTLARERSAVNAAESLELSADTRAFIEANIRETLYHELAHALIEVLDLPLFGPEEAAADMFAVVLLNRLFDDDQLAAQIPHVAAAYKDGMPREGLGQRAGGGAPWGLHGSDAQRYYTFVCLMYGADPEARADLPEAYNLPESRAETCADEYEMTHAAWSEVLDDIAPSRFGRAAPLKMDWILDETAPLAQFVSAEVAALSEVIALPEPVVVSVIPCDDANAFYDPVHREIIICTELEPFLAKMLRD